MPVLNPEALIDNRVQAIIAAHDRASILKAELDLSGGIDSAVMAGLLVEALGPENVILVHSGMSTNPEQTARASALAEALGCPMINIDLSALYENFITQAGEAIAAAYGDESLNDVNDRCNADKTILGSIRSTLRAPVGRAFNRLLGGGIRHGTGNECEDRFLRFYQKGGDGEVDSNPIAMLSKGEVYQLAFALGKRLGCEAQYRTIIEATPSPDLWGEGDAHSDEAELLNWTGAPFTYSRINPETGEYSYVGSIERVSRFLDEPTPGSDRVGGLTNEVVLFHDGDLSFEIQVIALRAVEESAAFTGWDIEEVQTLLSAARKVERITRHKMNPNCPAYGDRASLVEEGILTNELPAL
jgi:NAD+ synthetase